ncbi:LPXTG cell wall anchor domain-containing protein [Phytohabitans aurantiacus]
MPKTGSDVALTAGAGAALLFCGASILLLARRRRNQITP